MDPDLEDAIAAPDKFPDIPFGTGIKPILVRVRGGIAGLLVLTVLALVGGEIESVSAQPATDRDRLRLAVEYLLGSQAPSGLFLYDFDFLAGRSVDVDNVVRQAGTAYFLAEYYLHARDPRVRLAIEATLKKLDELSLPISKSALQSALEQTRLLSLPIGRYKLRAGLERLGLLYRPRGDGKVISLEGRYLTAETGATAVALLAELQYEQATGDRRFGLLRTAWLKGLLSLRIPGRGFRISPGFIDDTPYYDGEGWLALAYYNDLFPRDESVAAILESLDAYLMARYAGEVKTGFYQWGTMAAARRFKATSNQKFTTFIRAQTQAYLGVPRSDQWRGNNTCSDMEGLATAAAVLRAHGAADGALLERLEARMAEEMESIRRLQIPPDTSRMDFGEGVYLISPRLRDFPGAFLESRYRPYTRVDATGHCVSVMVKLAS
jgi:hypothetical protein